MTPGSTFYPHFKCKAVEPGAVIRFLFSGRGHTETMRMTL